MKTLFTLLSFALLLALAGSSAAAPIAFENAVLRLEIGTLPGITVSGADGTADLDGAGNLTLPNAVFSTQVAVPGPWPTSPPPVASVIVAGATTPQVLTGLVGTRTVAGPLGNATNGTGTFAPGSGISGGFGGKMPINGVALVGIFGLFLTPLDRLPVPISVVGSGGVVMVTNKNLGAVTVTGAGWTTGTVTLPTDTGVTSRVGSDGRTANGAGTLSLVTPIRINAAAIGFVPAFGVMTLTFVPEPSPPLLVLASSLLLAGGLHRRRARTGR